jgi:hypothetical protein
MNIFYLANNTKECAALHVDKHVVKMILEYAQILSTTHRLVDNIDGDSPLYKATHRNHPSTIWARQSVDNYKWLYSLFCDVLDEYTFRYGKEHKSARLKNILANPPKKLVNTGFTEPTPAMPDEYKVKNNSLESYRNYYKYGKVKLHSWKNREVPNWIITK